MGCVPIKKVILIVLDGWGISTSREANAIALAMTPNMDGFYEGYPNTVLNTSGLAVGLPEGQMGNSEVGHLTLGAGRVVFQELTRIDKAIQTGEFYDNHVLKDAISRIKERGAALHLLGLVSDGGVHSHIRHLYSLLNMTKKNGLKDVYIHAFVDGRDTPPKSGKGFIEDLQSFIVKEGVGRIATISGRYYAMDRDKRWERVDKAYKVIACSGGRKAGGPVEAMEAAYQKGETDEFIVPTVIGNREGLGGAVKDGDGMLFFNFRADRARELTRAFTQDGFCNFNIEGRSDILFFICFTEYDAKLHLPTVFPPQSLKNILTDILSTEGLSQFRIAETEKYAHVTFFFNGGVEKPFKGEERLLIPSPREVPTYDMKPEMSAFGVTDEVVKRIEEDKDDFILINYANGDMVGHTGVISAAVRACEVVDESLGRVVKAARDKNWTVIITSDHGNVEQMVDYATGEAHTAHTSDRVPFILIDDDMKDISLREGGLADVAPTILELMALEKPDEMSGESLIKGE
jgi:2,3-bisphosphoglycerate-independent phosphoglycerate mutase